MSLLIPEPITFPNPDRDQAVKLRRKAASELHSTAAKDFAAIKIIYGLILDEESQDFTRRRVELSEREFEEGRGEADELLNAEEIQYRMSALLGKESPR